jgi:gamma-glutamylcyclotransferase (GGCT)/AIG2-like uncharacterized protein YtfP
MKHLFVYGTLLQSENTFGHYVQNHSKYLTKGRFEGRLFNIGEYPGAVQEPGSDSFVLGSIVLLKHPEEALNLMDAYEGFGAEQPQPNEFVRSEIEIDSEFGTIRCWTYLYNHPVEQFYQIKNGDYLKFLAEKHKKTPE